MPARDPLAAALKALKKLAVKYPDVVEDHPWGESAFKIRGKVFLFVSIHKGMLCMTVKLPSSNRYALTQPFAEPSGYGLAKSGWVTSKFNPGDAVPIELLEDWIEESFRTVAPKKVVAAMDKARGEE